jgi:hypothetical protein
MDDSKDSIFPDEPHLWPAPGRPSAVADPPSAELARSHEPAAPAGLTRSGPTQPRRNDLSGGASVASYCGNGDEITQGFLIALSAMGVAVVKPAAEPAKPAAAKVKP